MILFSIPAFIVKSLKFELRKLSHIIHSQWGRGLIPLRAWPSPVNTPLVKGVGASHRVVNSNVRWRRKAAGWLICVFDILTFSLDNKKQKSIILHYHDDIEFGNSSSNSDSHYKLLDATIVFCLKWNFAILPILNGRRQYVCPWYGCTVLTWTISKKAYEIRQIICTLPLNCTIGHFFTFTYIN